MKETSFWQMELVLTVNHRFIPFDIRPDILVKVLPALEDILYGMNFSNTFSQWNHPVVDIIAWFPCKTYPLLP